MSALQAFAFDSHAVRVVTKDGAPWFVAKDVCECIGLSKHRDAIARLDADERASEVVDTLGGEQEMAVINESGLYTIILRSNGATTPGTPSHTFRKWVTAEVLPAIRQTGRYSAQDAMASVIQTSPDRGAQILDTLVRLLERSEAREERLMSLMERLLPAPGNTRRKGKTMYAADMARIKAMRAAGATLEDMVAATGFSQTQVSYVIGDQVRIKPDGRVVTVHRYAQALAAEKSREEARKQQGGNDLFGELPEAEASSRPTQLTGQSERATPYRLPPNPHRCAGAERACPSSAPDLSSGSPAPDSAHTPAPETSPQERKIQPMAGFPANPYRT